MALGAALFFFDYDSGGDASVLLISTLPFAFVSSTCASSRMGGEANRCQDK